MQGRRWPLCIDPQIQANKWLKNMFSSEDLVVYKVTQKSFLKRMSDAVFYGKRVLLEDVGENLDPGLNTIIQKSIKRIGGVYEINIGGSDVTYNNNFQFYMTTKLGNPTYAPDISTRVTLINFAVKQKGLEE